jgi:hypothetical protein
MSRTPAPPHPGFSPFLVAVIAIASAAGQSQAIVGGYAPSANEYRFDAVAAFGVTDNLCGPNSYNINSGSATLIDCELALTSWHLLSWSSHQFDDENFYMNLPPAGHFSLRFRRNEDGTLGSINSLPPLLGCDSFHDVEIAEYFLPAQQFNTNHDIVLVRLACPVTHIDPIRVRFESHLSIPPNSPLTVAGWGRKCVTVGQNVCPCAGNTPLSKELLVADLLSDEHIPGLLWPNPCGAACSCGTTSNDSGGAVLKVLPCGAVELLGVIKTGGNGVNLFDFQSVPGFPIPVYESPCPADLSDDGVVDGGDLGLLLLEWGTPGCIGEELPCEADLDCNGIVDGSDLGLLLLAWGTCPPGCEALPIPPECESEDLMGGAGPSTAQGATAEASESDSFYQWALGATIDELFEWLNAFFLETQSPSGDE